MCGLFLLDPVHIFMPGLCELMLIPSTRDGSTEHNVLCCCVSEAAQKYALVFASIDRSQQLCKYYHKCHTVSFLSLYSISLMLIFCFFSAAAADIIRDFYFS